MEILTMRSKLMFNEFQMYYGDRNRSCSAPKKGVGLPFDRFQGHLINNTKKLN